MKMLLQFSLIVVILINEVSVIIFKATNLLHDIMKSSSAGSYMSGISSSFNIDIFIILLLMNLFNLFSFCLLVASGKSSNTELCLESKLRNELSCCK